MILLFGGTSETESIATALANLNIPVMVSTATDVPLKTGAENHPLITHRCGRLGLSDMVDLMTRSDIRLIVNAGHPYADELHQTIAGVVRKTGIRCFRFQRQETVIDDEHVYRVGDHQAAAELAFSFARPVLLTVGSRHLEPYVAVAKKTQIPLVVRVLPHRESIEACKASGLPDESCIYARGPFSEEENSTLIRRFDIGVLVSKDSGTAGGVPEKIAAATDAGCAIVLLGRPAVATSDWTNFETVSSLVKGVDELRL
ncbi:precorrin-6A/cobalt-precorrin-6A reductase [Desulfuromusa kysingii]|uniref:Precorrin-6A/cobalt-precorrin-6A reductase n=1 Tax=Desulfuromusa kysingii TaxID=37625 RepID=A0A1H4AI44_9BACT|nr:precorrin-6A reductase [Desulfuromusa kysingii]SEA35418.1 precorrin-6A/cobalt-precorrin-6A reductase [Desulfuromusa kysingii]